MFPVFFFHQNKDRVSAKAYTILLYYTGNSQKPNTVLHFLHERSQPEAPFHLNLAHLSWYESLILHV